MPQTRRLTAPLAAAFLCLALSWLGAACGGEKTPPPGAAAEKLKVDLTRDYRTLAPTLARTVGAGELRASQAALDDLWAGSEAHDAPLWYAVILDIHGVVFCERLPPEMRAKDDPDKDAPLRLNLADYPAVVSALKHGKPRQEVLYLPADSRYGENMYAVCWPLLQDGQVVGALAQVLLQETVQKLGVSEQAFNDLKFQE